MKNTIKGRFILIIVTLFIGWGNLFFNHELIGREHPIFSLFVFSCIGVGSFQIGVLIGYYKNN